jgi:hypothetical protein
VSLRRGRHALSQTRTRQDTGREDWMIMRILGSARDS